MKGKVPYTPISTHLSNSARETELRLRNIFSGPKKRPPVLFLALMFSACIFCGNLVSCQNAEASDTPDLSVDAPDDLTVPPGGGMDSQDFELYATLNDYYQDKYSGGAWYWGVDTPDQPQEGDIQLGPVEYLGSGYAGTQLGSVYTIERRYYREEFGGWTEPATDTVVLKRGADGAPASVVPAGMFTEGLTGEDIVFRVLHDVPNPELALYQEGYPYPLGLRSRNFVNYAADYILNTEPQVEIHEDWEPSYDEGGYWATLSWEGLSAVCYYNGSEGAYWPSMIDVTRSDLYTPRGVRVGDSREKVLTAYPDLQDAYVPQAGYVSFRGIEIEGRDVLWWNVDGSDFAPEALLFFFEGDALSRIVAHYTMD